MATLLSIDDVLSQLHISRTLLWRLRQSGNFPSPIRLGQRRIAFDQSSLDSWIAAQVPATNDTEA